VVLIDCLDQRIARHPGAVTLNGTLDNVDRVARSARVVSSRIGPSDPAAALDDCGHRAVDPDQGHDNEPVSWCQLHHYAYMYIAIMIVGLRERRPPGAGDDCFLPWLRSGRLRWSRFFLNQDRISGAFLIQGVEKPGPLIDIGASGSASRHARLGLRTSSGPNYHINPKITYL
jgi:hypothetical protein